MRRLERAYALIGIVFYEQGIIQALRAARGAEALKPGSSDIVSTVSQLAILSRAAASWRHGARAYRPLVRPMLPYVGIVALCFASTLWSDNPWRRCAAPPPWRAACCSDLSQAHARAARRRRAGRAVRRVPRRCSRSRCSSPCRPSGGKPRSATRTPCAACSRRRTRWRNACCSGSPAIASACWTRAAGRHAGALAMLLLCIALGRSATSLGIAALVLLATAFMATRHAAPHAAAAVPRRRMGGAWRSCVGVVAPELLFAALRAGRLAHRPRPALARGDPRHRAAPALRPRLCRVLERGLAGRAVSLAAGGLARAGLA